MMTNLIENDLAQRQQALTPDQSFIVQAPAGSGKTELLIQRLLVLLSSVDSPKEILAITFTKKAANEMRERIIQALADAQFPRPDQAHKQQTWDLAQSVLKRDRLMKWDLLTNPNQLRIQTIDSFCAYLTRQLPLLSQFGAQPELVENATGLYEEATTELLIQVDYKTDCSDSLKRLLSYLDNDIKKVHDLLVSLLAKRDQWLPYIHFNDTDDQIKQFLENNIRLIIEDHLQLLSTQFPENEKVSLLAIARFTAGNLSQVTSTFERFPNETIIDLDTWRYLANLLLKKDGDWRKQLRSDIGFPALADIKNKDEKAVHKGYRESLTTLIKQLSEYENLRESLAWLNELPDPEISKQHWHVLSDIIHILKILTAHLHLAFQLHGKVDFVENALGGLRALGTEEQPTDLAFALDYKIKHILVDEFQDTSSTQYSLLKQLTLGWEDQDGRTLFVVGDPMQSIYRFREAEVGLFIRMRQSGIANIRLTPITLSLNFRSTPHIVDWINHHFKTIFPDNTDFLSGAVHYSLSASNKNPELENKNSEIKINGFCGLGEQAEAKRIAEWITQLKQASPNDSIAILVRSRAHLISIIPALKQADISYRAIDIDPLNSRQVIQDLLSLTCALLQPADRIAWLSVLRSPCCGLTLADLLIIARDKRQFIFDQLCNPALLSDISEHGRKRLNQIVPILKTSLANRQRYPLRYWIENTWLLLGGPACLSAEDELDDVNVYLELLGTLDEGSSYSVELLKEKTKTLFASAGHDPNAVHITTIHSAKGLEYDTVILPHLEKQMRSDDKSLFMWMEHPLAKQSMALLLAPIHSKKKDENKLYNYIREMQSIKAKHESVRLFYVAATRAKKRLYLTFSIANKEKWTRSLDFAREDTLKTGDKRHKSSSTFLDKLKPFIKEEWIEYSEISEADISTGNAAYRLNRLTDNWINPVKPYIDSGIKKHQSHEGFLLSQFMPQIIGTSIHTILQQLASNGIDWWLNSDKEKRNIYINQILRKKYPPLNEVDKAREIVLKAIHQTINDERGKWILGKHQDAHSEYALTTIINNKITNLVIDRTFICKEGYRWIIDYKTSSPSDSNQSGFLQREKQKYQEQMQAYANAFTGLRNEPVRLALYFPLLPGWVEY